MNLEIALEKFEDNSIDLELLKDGVDEETIEVIRKLYSTSKEIFELTRKINE